MKRDYCIPSSVLSLPLQSCREYSKKYNSYRLYSTSSLFIVIHRCIPEGIWPMSFVDNRYSNELKLYSAVLYCTYFHFLQSKSRQYTVLYYRREVKSPTVRPTRLLGPASRYIQYIQYCTCSTIIVSTSRPFYVLFGTKNTD